MRITLTAFPGNARIPMQIDMGLGDAIPPGVEAVEFPLMLTMRVLPAAKLNAYPREIVIGSQTLSLRTLADAARQNVPSIPGIRTPGIHLRSRARISRLTR